MTQQTTRKARVHTIKGKINFRVLDNVFKSKDFREGILEPIKNAFDAGATMVFIDTTENAKIVMRDNGSGMFEANREAYTKPGESTSMGDPSKTGYFGSGRLHFAVPLCTEMTVITAPSNEQDTVWKTRFDMTSYLKDVVAETEFNWEGVDKSTASWPYEHETGTVITWVIKPELLNGEVIKRGDKLAQMLSTVLPPFVARKIRVDGKKLPERKVIGEIFNDALPIKRIGTVTANLFRPKKRSGDDGLRIGGKLVGEVSFENFRMMLPLELRDQLPAVFNHPECCGEIICELFSRYSTDSRDKFSPSLLTDSGLSMFISALERFAPKVEECLELEISEGDASGAPDPVAERLSNSLVRRFGEVDNEEPGGTDPEPGQPPQPTHHPMYLTVNCSHGLALRQLEPGETADIGAEIRKDLRDNGSTVKDIEWDTEGAEPCTMVKKLGDGSVRLRAKSVGVARVTAALSDAVMASCAIEVVEKREIALSHNKLKLKEGESFRFKIVNPDKLGERKLAWAKVNGAGNLEVAPDGLSAAFTATNRGITEIQVSANGESPEHMRCEIIVRAATDPAKLIRIQDRKFRLTVKKFTGDSLVSIMFGIPTDRPGELVVNMASPLYEQLAAIRSEDAFDMVILTAVSQAFTAKRLVQDDLRPKQDIKPLMIDRFLTDQVVNPMIRLLADMLAAAPPSSSTTKSSRSKGKSRSSKTKEG